MARFLLYPGNSSIGRQGNEGIERRLTASSMVVVWADQWAGGNTITLPTCPEFQDDITLVAELLDFLTRQITRLPDKHEQLFQLVCLVDYVGSQGFLTLTADALDVDVATICNVNPIRRVRADQGKVPCTQDKQNNHTQCMVWGVCFILMTSEAPRKAKLIDATRCYWRFMHHQCYWDEPECQVCNVPLWVLPCVVCCDLVLPPERTTHSMHHQAHEMIWKYRLVCCGAKHADTTLKFRSCPLCRTPIRRTQTGVALYNDLTEWYSYGLVAAHSIAYEIILKVCTWYAKGEEVQWWQTKEETRLL